MLNSKLTTTLFRDPFNVLDVQIVRKYKRKYKQIYSKSSRVQIVLN